jgi:hypothetical protein
VKVGQSENVRRDMTRFIFIAELIENVRMLFKDRAEKSNM